MSLYYVFLALFAVILWVSIGFAQWVIIRYITQRFDRFYMNWADDWDLRIILGTILFYVWPLSILYFVALTFALGISHLTTTWKTDGKYTIQDKISFAAHNHKPKPKKPKYDFMRDSNRKLKRGFSKNE